MNISKRYTWQSVGNCRENSPLLPQSLRGLVIGKNGCGKTTVIFNLLLGWTIITCIYLGRAFTSKSTRSSGKGFEGGLSKQQISNVFNSQEKLQSTLIAIEKYSGVRNGDIRTDFYDDSQDPSALDTMQKNLLLLDDCFLGKRTTLMVDTTIAIQYTLHKTTSAYPAIQFGIIHTLLTFSRKT